MENCTFIKNPEILNVQNLLNPKCVFKKNFLYRINKYVISSSSDIPWITILICIYLVINSGDYV